jgi:hypothetical protein
MKKELTKKQIAKIVKKIKSDCYDLACKQCAFNVVAKLNKMYETAKY